MIFKTSRLSIRKLQTADQDLFFEMMSNLNVMLPIPQQPMNRKESDAKLSGLMNKAATEPMKIWAITIQGQDEFIGICGFLKNNEQDDEIAYRLIERYWGNGYGKEIAKGLIDFAFDKMGANKITADVNTANLKSVKILDRFLKPVREFYNEKDKCTDRRYALVRINYKK